MTLFCITIIIIVALICATRLYPLWLRHDCKRNRKLMRLLQEQREDNNHLRQELSKTYDEWFNDFSEHQKKIYDMYDNIYEITETLKAK